MPFVSQLALRQPLRHGLTLVVATLAAVISAAGADAAPRGQKSHTKPQTTQKRAPTPKPGPAAPEVSVERPPQYVLLAFDGSQSHEMWRATMDLADTLTAEKKPARFTYFISGVYFLAEKHRRLYVEPGRGPGRSAIGWGSSKDNDIVERIARVNEAHAKGHEIASHANGHFSGSDWSEAQWRSEFQQFNRLLFDAGKNNELPAGADGTLPSVALEPRQIVGFRAPQLGTSTGLWSTLGATGFRYDTSRTANPDYWPQKLPASGWNFPLAEIRIPGTAVRTLSMDYNFYYAQSGGKPYKPKAALFEQQMYEAYIQYFNANYTGNRAPVHIGHHFTKWNDGAYWRAFQRFARAVCGKPEVRCITNRELADVLDQQKPETLEAWKKARFPKFADAAPLKTTLGPALDITLTLAPVGRDGRLVLKAAGRDWRARDYRVTLEIGGEERSVREATLAAVRAAVPAGGRTTIAWRITARSGVEVARLTHEIEKVGTRAERISAKPLEARALEGEPAGAHEESAHDHEHF